MSAYPTMYPALLLYILGCLVAGIIGVVSAAIVFGLWWLLSRRVHVRLEMMFLICGSVGLATMFVGKTIDSHALSAISVALWGWVVLPILAIPVFLLWRLVAWCRQRIAGQPADAADRPQSKDDACASRSCGRPLIGVTSGSNGNRPNYRLALWA